MREGVDSLKTEDEANPEVNNHMSKKLLLLLAVAGFIVGIDQATKLYIHTHFQLADTIAVIEGYFNLTYVRNYGAAFGFLSSAPEQFRDFFFLTMPPLALIFVLVILRTVPVEDKIQSLALSSVFGGAIGNYIDRLRFGFVVDFLDVHIQNEHSWPAFNVADIAIVCGILVLMVLIFRDLKEDEEPENNPAT